MEKGSYTLVLKLEETKEIKVGSLGPIKFEKGFYSYNGSAMGPGGLKRIQRHKSLLKGQQKYTVNWHIDYLTSQEEASFVKAFTHIGENLECAISQKLDLKSVNKFGSTDCNCKSHLYYSEDKEKMIDQLKQLYSRN